MELVGVGQEFNRILAFSVLNRVDAAYPQCAGAG
jgi:hypothetical protein